MGRSRRPLACLVFTLLPVAVPLTGEARWEKQCRTVTQMQRISPGVLYPVTSEECTQVWISDPAPPAQSQTSIIDQFVVECRKSYAAAGLAESTCLRVAGAISKCMEGGDTFQACSQRVMTEMEQTKRIP